MAKKLINETALRAGLERIKAHPEEWDQIIGSCGTTGCYAHHIAMAAGWRVVGSDMLSKEGVSQKYTIDAALYEIFSGETPDDDEGFYNATNLFNIRLSTIEQLEQAIEGFINDHLES